MNYRIPNKPILVRCSWESRDESYPMSELARIQALMEEEEELDELVPSHNSSEFISRYEKIPQTMYPSPEEICLDHDNSSALLQQLVYAFSCLSTKQQRIVRCVLRHPGEPLSIPAKELGITRERVRQVMNQYRTLVLGSPPAKTGPGRKRWRELL